MTSFTPIRLCALAAAGSAIVLGAAFLSQSFGWAPCKMCIWQRWPHVAAILAGLLLFFLPVRIVAALGGAAAAVTAAIGLYHSGVERAWWQGPVSCSGSGADLGRMAAADLIPGSAINDTLIKCDAFDPFLLGLTMANLNALISTGLVFIWILAAIQPRQRPLHALQIPS